MKKNPTQLVWNTVLLHSSGSLQAKFHFMDHSEEVTSSLELLARGAITNSQRHYYSSGVSLSSLTLGENK